MLSDLSFLLVISVFYIIPDILLNIINGFNHEEVPKG